MWSLVTYARPGDDRTSVGVRLADGSVRSLRAFEWAHDVIDVVKDWSRLEPALKALDPRAGSVIADAVLRAPLRFPDKIVCAGANYADHLRELGLEPKPGPVFFFLKPPPSTVVGPGEAIRIPTADGARVDYEGELGVVIGKPGGSITREDAMGHVAGYTIVNDVSARGLLARPDPLVPAMGFDWISSKGRDTFCPTGPGITPSWLVQDPHALSLELSVNGEVRQSATTGGMTASIPELIAQVSALMSLAPGDVIATGTPAGVAMASGRYLRPGDEISIRIDGLGVLTNPVEGAS
ncbi:fumarylacetoacetate hydrolase family protein [Actinomadura syzygii]|uniref:Fumarylacetoacetate hydrolase family protein n=1 Tax=Actinomadura syzygii TaxID=1427538 RepID=A0A5D0TPN8_9ACTN|nr:fumarylacetoacetate hydrolase family protein [Actinomadura syzygii]